WSVHNLRANQAVGRGDPVTSAAALTIEPLAILAETLPHLHVHCRRPEIRVGHELSDADNQPERNGWRQTLQWRSSAVPHQKALAGLRVRDFAPYHAEENRERNEGREQIRRA